MGRKNQPIVSIAKSKKKGSYIWDEFIAEYKLNLEISHVYLNGKQQVYFIRVGQFSAVPFSILEQLKMQKTFGYSCIRHQQMKLVKSLAGISISLLAIPSVEIELAGMEKSTTGPSSSSSFNFNVTDTVEVSIVDESEVENFKSLLQLHLFDRICKNGVDSSSLWKVIDTSKLKEGHQCGEHYPKPSQILVILYCIAKLGIIQNSMTHCQIPSHLRQFYQRSFLLKQQSLCLFTYQSMIQEK
jgi:hypothetical protein